MVVKIGTKVLTDSSGNLDLTILRGLCGQAARLNSAGTEVIIVTSGAIACGRSRLAISGEDRKLETQQACASVGQAILMEYYNSFLSKLGKSAAQFLLTSDDFANEKRFANLLNSINRALALGAVPVVNENDAVSTSELDLSEGRDEALFGDNDMLSACLAAGVRADCLLILSSVGGLLDSQRRVVAEASAFDCDVEKFDFGGVQGRGGLRTKLKAFRKACATGISCFLADGREDNVIGRIVSGEKLGTFFAPKPEWTQAEDLSVSAMADLAKGTAGKLAQSAVSQRNFALLAMADLVEASSSKIIAANEVDLNAAAEAGESAAFLDRLKLDSKRVDSLCQTLRNVAALSCGDEVLREWSPASGLKIRKVRVPLGAMVVIFESRPDVAVEATALALKAGNPIVLKGGKEAGRTNALVASLLAQGASLAGLPSGSVQFFNGNREQLTELLKRSDCFELVVARGGRKLIDFAIRESEIPVICAGGGNCHLYVHEDADVQMAVRIAVDSKASKPSACNSIETLLVNAKIAGEFLPLLAREMVCKGVELRCCAQSRAIIEKHGISGIGAAVEGDWKTEFLAPILAVRVVPNLEAAVEHIRSYGTQHSESIASASREAAEKFQRETDAAAVYWNASTRFTDGAQFGFGAEVCISTQKLHARGPVGLEGLSTYKFVVEGQGQVRN